MKFASAVALAVALVTFHGSASAIVVPPHLPSVPPTSSGVSPDNNAATVHPSPSSLPFNPNPTPPSDVPPEAFKNLPHLPCTLMDCQTAWDKAAQTWRHNHPSPQTRDVQQLLRRLTPSSNVRYARDSIGGSDHLRLLDILQNMHHEVRQRSNDVFRRKDLRGSPLWGFWPGPALPISNPPLPISSAVPTSSTAAPAVSSLHTSETGSSITQFWKQMPQLGDNSELGHKA